MKSHGPEDRDYYQIIGVPPTATLREITAAYHLLARRHHPDVNSTDPTLLAKFKLINEAYEILSNPQRRREYDRKRSAKFRNSSRSTGVRRAAKDAVVPGRRPTSRSPHPLRPRGTEVELPIAPEEARLGGPCQLVLRIPRVCDRCAGRQQVAGTLCPQCHGRGKVTTKHQLNIDLPPGLQTGSIIRLTGIRAAGEACAEGLFLRIRVQPYW